jgi:L-lactate dehydrogenase complex protein LldE
MSDVSLFIPCMVDLLMPEIGESVFRLLRRLDQKPVYHEEQTCCGQPAISSGYNAPAIEAAKHFISIFENDEAIVSPSGSCVYTVKYDYPKLLADDPAWLKRAEGLSNRVFELSQYLVDVLGLSDVGSVFDGKVAFHESCKNLRGLGVSDQPKQLLQGVRGTEVVPLNGAEICCGFGGSFAVGYPEISEGMVKDKSTSFIESGADRLILSEPGCLLNVSGYLEKHHPEKQALHLASFLMESQEGGD